MNVYEMGSFKVVTTTNNAFVLPNETDPGGHSISGHLVFVESCEAVAFSGCVCGKCFDVTCKHTWDILTFLKDSGFMKVNLMWYKGELGCNRDSIDIELQAEELGMELTHMILKGESWFFQPFPEGTEENTSFSNKLEFLCWVIASQTRLADQEGGQRLSAEELVSLTKKIIQDT
jgi:hypothetical protein